MYHIGRATTHRLALVLSPAGTVFMTLHFPETRTNILLSSAADEYTQCPESKVSAVAIEKQ